jgi:hypothetical protein
MEIVSEHTHKVVEDSAGHAVIIDGNVLLQSKNSKFLKIILLQTKT